jgi:nucleoside-triphosphatase THEP1
MEKSRLSDKWIKASIAGTIWAASEIVLGSFLHNLRIPFSGNILTAIGLIILISLGYIWTDRGIFWRAGLICALMKTMSPSAVIFGPMIAIFTESLLLELFVRIFGRNILGFAVGSMLAMSWNLFQKILNYVIFYGTNIIGIYSNLLKFAQKQLSIKSDIVWMPIIVLLILYGLFGLFAAIVGIRIGRSLQREPSTAESFDNNFRQELRKGDTAPEFGYSVTWLFVNFMLMIALFFLLNLTPWYIWGSTIIVVILIWILRYKRAFRQLSKPGFWLFFVAITLLAAFVFTEAAPGENAILKGLMTGLQMNFRAALMILGFSVLGTELYNPAVRKFFMKSSFKNLPLALELSAESLPVFIAGIPDLRTLVKNPVSVLRKVILNAESRLHEIRGRENRGARVILVTGTIRGGKTTFAGKLADSMQKKGITILGILSIRVNDESGETGYDLRDIETGRVIPFLRQAGSSGDQTIGKFFILSEGLADGRELLHSSAGRSENIVIIDEVGMLELNDGGWAVNLTELLNSSKTIIITVRDKFIEGVIEKWGLINAETVDISISDPEAVVKMLL